MRSSRRRSTVGVVAVLVAVALGSCTPAERAVAPAEVAAAPTSAPPTTLPPVAPPAPVPVRVMAASVPVRIEIASLGVDSELVELGLEDDGTLEVPAGAFPAGWFSGAPTPGELGPAVIVGHIDWVTGPGVFFRLAELAVGAEIRVSRTDGSVAVFRTTGVARYPKDAFPSDLVYGDIDHAGLRLVSCGGEFDRSTGHYEDNVVAFAELVT
jgi:hypothetical protein